MTEYTCELCGKDYLQKECPECGTKIAYKVICKQGSGALSYATFISKKEVIERLADFHSVDFEDERYEDIYALLDTIKTEEEKLAWLCEHGVWDIEEIIIQKS